VGPKRLEHGQRDVLTAAGPGISDQQIRGSPLGANEVGLLDDQQVQEILLLLGHDENNDREQRMDATGKYVAVKA